MQSLPSNAEDKGTEQGFQFIKCETCGTENAPTAKLCDRSGARMTDRTTLIRRAGGAAEANRVMVEIEYLPYQKIIVHEVRKLEVNEFLQWVASQVEAQKQGGTPSVNWVDGVAFLTGEFMATPQLVEENLKGRIHYAVVFYTETSYQPEKRIMVGGRDAIVRLNKGDSNPNFVELARFLKGFRPAGGAPGNA